MYSAIKQILLFVALYIYIYSPPFVHVSLTPIEWLIPVSYLYLLQTDTHKQFLTLFKKEILVLVLLIIYTFVRGILSGSSEMPYLLPNVLMLMEVFPIAFFIAHYTYSDKGKTHRDADKMELNVVVVSLVAALITFYLILNQDLAFIVNNIILRSNEFTEAFTNRCFGLSASLTYSYGIAQGIVAAIVLYKMSKSNSSYALFYAIAFVFIFISVIFNARTGLMPILYMMLYLLTTRFSFKYVYAGLFIVLLLYLIFTSGQYSANFEENLKWSTKIITETQEVLTDESSGGSNTYRVIFEEMMFLPDNISDLVFGTGENILLTGEKTSDVGYVIQIYFGGLLYLGILMYFVAIIYSRISKIIKYRWFAHLFLAVTLVCNIKGYFIYNDVAFRLLLLLYITFVYSDSLTSARSRELPANRVSCQSVS